MNSGALIFAAGLFLASSQVSAAVGMVADDASDKVIVFDTTTHIVKGTVSIPPGAVIGDVLIAPDGKTGFVTNFDFKVFVIDLTTSPPTLASGTNPISIDNFGEDLSITKDGKYLLVTDGDPVAPISVIDVATRRQIGSFSTGSNNTAVAVCDDNSVLVASFGDGLVRRFTLSAAGVLTNSGAAFAIFDPTNVYCAPGSKAGFVVNVESKLASFTLPAMTGVDTRILDNRTGTPDVSAITGALNPTGEKAFARTQTSVMKFDFNPVTGALGAGPLLTIPVASVIPFFGVDQLAATDKEIYVPQPGVLSVYDSVNGSLVSSITDPAISLPTGVTVASSQFNFSGFIQPVDNLPNINVVKAGSAVPVKFSLGGNQGLNVLQSGYPASQPIACSGTAANGEIEQTVTAGNSALHYDAAIDQYTYVWKTDKAWTGTCRQLILRLADGTDHKALFNFAR